MQSGRDSDGRDGYGGVGLEKPDSGVGKPMAQIAGSATHAVPSARASTSTTSTTVNASNGAEVLAPWSLQRMQRKPPATPSRGATPRRSKSPLPPAEAPPHLPTPALVSHRHQRAVERGRCLIALEVVPPADH